MRARAKRGTEQDVRHPVTAARALGARVGRLLAAAEAERWAGGREQGEGQGTESTQRRRGAEGAA